MRVVISGGGSGGHIYPALAIAEGIRQRDPACRIMYVGSAHGLESDLVPRAHFPFGTIHAKGLLVRGLSGKITGVLSALRGLMEARAILRREHPDVVVGTGGYVSGPVGLAARWLGIPLVIQEQNAWPGFTNRTLARRAAAVIAPYEESRKYFPPGTRLVVAGNPVELRDQHTPASARKALGLDSQVTLLMATGGSQGAEAINQAMLDLLPAVAADPALGMIWATGRRYFSRIQQALEKCEQPLDPNRIRIVEYFYDIQTVLRASDVFFGRAGAMSLADCEAYGLPAVLVPSPHVSEDHQTKNAMVIEKRGAGVVIPETQLAIRVSEILNLMREAKPRKRMSEAMSALYDRDALNRILDVIFQAARGRGRRR